MVKLTLNALVSETISSSRHTTPSPDSLQRMLAFLDLLYC